VTTLQLVPELASPRKRSTKPKVRRDRTYTASGVVGRHLQAAQALQLQIQTLSAELDGHRSWLLAHMNQHNLDQLELEQFSALRKTRHNWTYSPETERDALALRTTQKWEQSQGLATDNPTVYIALSTRAPEVNK
jgi:hypothetical protein